MNVFIADIQAEKTRGRKRGQPFVHEGIEQGRILRGRDVDSVSRGQSLPDGFFGSAQGDDEVGRREQFAGQRIEAAAQVKLCIVEKASGVEKSREAMEVQIEAAVGQRNVRRGAQAFFLFGAQEQIVELVGERITRILFACARRASGKQ